MATCTKETNTTSETTTEVEVVTTEDPPATLQSIIDISDLWDQLLLFVPPSTLCGAISKVFSLVPWIEQALTPAAPTGVFAQWRRSNGNGWHCCWSESTDPDVTFVFKPPLEQTACGVVRPAAWDYTAPPAREVYRELIKLLALASDTRIGNGRRGIGWGDQGDGQWIPFLVPWSFDTDGALTPEALLRKLGAHPELSRPGAVTVREWGMGDREWDEYDEEDEDDEVDENDAFRNALNSWLSAWQLMDDPFSAFGHYGDPTLVFNVRSSMLNPVPCFAVAQVAHSLCDSPRVDALSSAGGRLVVRLTPF